jgi:hypothetical protein
VGAGVVETRSRGAPKMTRHNATPIGVGAAVLGSLFVHDATMLAGRCRPSRSVRSTCCPSVLRLGRWSGSVRQWAASLWYGFDRAELAARLMEPRRFPGKLWS